MNGKKETSENARETQTRTNAGSRANFGVVQELRREMGFVFQRR